MDAWHCYAVSVKVIYDNSSKIYKCGIIYILQVPTLSNISLLIIVFHHVLIMIHSKCCIFHPLLLRNGYVRYFDPLIFCRFYFVIILFISNIVQFSSEVF